MDVLAKGQQLRLLAHTARSARQSGCGTRPARSKAFHTIVAQGRQSAALRELEAQQEERASQALENKTPVAKDLTWERPLEIIKYPDPRLRAVNAKIGVFGDNVKQLGMEMLEVMYNGDDGVGLAAPQVGVNVRMMVYNPTGRRGDEEFILVNPQILSTNGRRELHEEGCLSFPRLFADVERPHKVKVRAQDVKGSTVMLTLNGWQARIFQHEYDHLQGTLFHDRMKPEELGKIKKGLVALEEEYLQLHPGATVQRV